MEGLGCRRSQEAPPQAMHTPIVSDSGGQDSKGPKHVCSPYAKQRADSAVGPFEEVYQVAQPRLVPTLKCRDLT